MPPQFNVILLTTLGALAYLFAVYKLDQSLTGANRVYFRYAAVIASAAIFLVGVDKVVPDVDRALGVKKAGIALAAAGCLFYEQHRVGIKRPIAERWKKFVG